jgi:arylsulfatase A-like enzyme
MAYNVLFITVDQFRGSCFVSGDEQELWPIKTPALASLAQQGIHFTQHYSQASPCAPGRASLYTGMYQMNHRVVANGTPLDNSLDNLALVMRRAGYAPALFGYTDQSVDPRITTGPDDPRLETYEGVLPGFDCVVDLTRGHDPWLSWLESFGVDTSRGVVSLLATEHKRSADLSVSTFLTNQFLDWEQNQEKPWCAHLSYLRPHPPYSAAGEYSTMYSGDELPEAIEVSEDIHPLHQALLAIDSAAAPTEHEKLMRMRAQYFGMISEVDAQLGRVFTELQERGEWENTIVVVTSDHGEMLGDHGLKEKMGYWEQAFHVPCIIRVPEMTSAHGTHISHFTENIDLLPTLCEVLDVPTPLQCDGYSLVPFLEGVVPSKWRTAATWEFDWSAYFIDRSPEGRWNRHLTSFSLVTRRTESHALVQMADGTSMCFDLATDPHWKTKETNTDIVLKLSQELHAWRMQHNRHNFTGFLVENGGIGRWSPEVAWRV